MLIKPPNRWCAVSSRTRRTGCAWIRCRSTRERSRPPTSTRRLTASSGSRPVLGIYSSVIVPSIISADSPRFLGFIPTAPTKASLLFDMLISCASIQGISWLEASGAIAAENTVLRVLADEAGLPEAAGGCFVSGGSAGNLSPLAVAREITKSRLGAQADGQRLRVIVTRRARGLPLWFSLAVYGLEAYREAIESAIRLARGIDQGNSAPGADPGAGSRCRTVPSERLEPSRLRRLGSSPARRGDCVHTSDQVGGGDGWPLRLPAPAHNDAARPRNPRPNRLRLGRSPSLAFLRTRPHVRQDSAGIAPICGLVRNHALRGAP
jgi:Pyridoxal-dependent decarboxylase conserved domain